MTRPLRLEFPGALYQITSRGDRREDIYLDEDGYFNAGGVWTTGSSHCRIR